MHFVGCIEMTQVLFLFKDWTVEIVVVSVIWFSLNIHVKIVWTINHAI